MSNYDITKLSNFNLDTTNNLKLTPSDFSNRLVILFFYPKDNTPGCTTENENFNSLMDYFNKANCTVYGVSPDSIKSHEKFKLKLKLIFELVSDPENTLSKIFDVYKLKKMYGREYMGIERSTFLFKNKKMIKEWRKVKVNGHASEVMDYVNNL
jgi:peroxiredoxin Q/BCP